MLALALLVGMAGGAQAKEKTETKGNKPVAVKKVQKKKQTKPKLTVSGSLDVAAMNDKVQLDGKLTLGYDKLGLFIRALETIRYDGQATTLALADLSYKLGHGLSAVTETQYFTGAGVHQRLGMGSYLGGKYFGGKLKLGTYNQLTASLQKQSNAEWFSDSTLEAKLKAVSLVANVEAVVNFGKDLNFYVLRPFVGVKYKSFSTGPYMQVSGGPKGKPVISCGVKLRISN